jgi:heme oxygenase
MSPRGIDTLAKVVERPILAELKETLAPYHRRVEMNVNLSAALASAAAYRNLLIKFFGITAALEDQLILVEDLEIWLPDISRRWKTPLLREDLAVWGAGFESYPICIDVPALESMGPAFGCLYVLEGGTLGGQIIARDVHKHLGLTPENGCRFFSSYGAEVGGMWKTFGRCLETWCAANVGCRDEVLEGAAETFACFTRWLSCSDPSTDGEA